MPGLLPRANTNKPTVLVRPRTWNAVMDFIEALAARGNSLEATLHDLKLRITKRWFAELFDKQIVDDHGLRFVQYAVFEFEFAQSGSHRPKEQGRTTRDYTAEDDFAAYAINLDEVHRSHVQHTGLILSATDFKRPCVEIIAIGSTNSTICRLFHKPLPELFIVDLVQVAGAQGTQTTKPTWTYHLKDEQGLTLNDSLNTPMAPIKPRNIGFYLPATKGLARWNNLQTTIELVEAWEEEGTEPC